MAVVGSGREKQPVLEPSGQIAHRAGELGVDRKFRAARRRRVVGLIKDQQRLLALIAEPVAQGPGVGLIAHKRLANDEAGVGRPRVDAPAPLPTHLGDVLPVQHGKTQPKAALHLPLPLQHHRRRRYHHHAVHLLTQQQLAHNQAGLNRLAQAHVVGDEQAHPRHEQGLAQRLQLVRLHIDAGPQRRLE